MTRLLSCGCEVDVQVTERKDDPKWNINMIWQVHFCRSHNEVGQLLNAYKEDIDRLVIESYKQGRKQGTAN